MYIHVLGCFMALRNNVLFHWPFRKMGILFISKPPTNERNSMYDLKSISYICEFRCDIINNTATDQWKFQPLSNHPSSFAQYRSNAAFLHDHKSHSIFGLVSLHPVNKRGKHQVRENQIIFYR